MVSSVPWFAPITFLPIDMKLGPNLSSGWWSQELEQPLMPNPSHKKFMYSLRESRFRKYTMWRGRYQGSGLKSGNWSSLVRWRSHAFRRYMMTKGSALKKESLKFHAIQKVPGVRESFGKLRYMGMGHDFDRTTRLWEACWLMRMPWVTGLMVVTKYCFRVPYCCGCNLIACYKITFLVFSCLRCLGSWECFRYGHSAPSIVSSRKYSSALFASRLDHIV